MITAASVAWGRPSKNGVSQRIVTMSITNTTTPKSGLRTLLASATAVRERLASVGKPCRKPASTLPPPSAISSWFGSTS